MDNKVSPSNGGCWFCHTVEGELDFSIEFDTYVHRECIKKEILEHPDNPEALIMAEELDI